MGCWKERAPGVFEPPEELVQEVWPGYVEEGLRKLATQLPECKGAMEDYVQVVETLMSDISLRPRRVHRAVVEIIIDRQRRIIEHNQNWDRLQTTTRQDLVRKLNQIGVDDMEKVGMDAVFGVVKTVLDLFNSNIFKPPFAWRIDQYFYE